MRLLTKFTWNYYRPVLFTNLLISIAFFTYFVIELDQSKFVYPILFGSIGFLFSFFLVRFLEKNTSYMYYNLGLSHRKLYLSSFIFNSVIAISIYFIIWLWIKVFENYM